MVCSPLNSERVADTPEIPPASINAFQWMPLTERRFGRSDAFPALNVRPHPDWPGRPSPPILKPAPPRHPVPGMSPTSSALRAAGPSCRWCRQTADAAASGLASAGRTVGLRPTSPRPLGPAALAGAIASGPGGWAPRSSTGAWARLIALGRDLAGGSPHACGHCHWGGRWPPGHRAGRPLPRFAAPRRIRSVYAGRALPVRICVTCAARRCGRNRITGVVHLESTCCSDHATFSVTPSRYGCATRSVPR